MQATPKMASPIRVSEIFEKMFSQTSMKLPAWKDSPRISLTWDVAIMIAAAEVNPADTGPEMKSIKKPLKKGKMFQNDVVDFN